MEEQSYKSCRLRGRLSVIYRNLSQFGKVLDRKITVNVGVLPDAMCLHFYLTKYYYASHVDKYVDILCSVVKY